MTPLARHLLEVDAATSALANTLGRSERGDAIRAQLRALRTAGHRLMLAELASDAPAIEPASAVRAVIACAVRAGLSWADLAAIFNQATDGRES